MPLLLYNSRHFFYNVTCLLGGIKMIYLDCDYSQGAHPDILKALARMNFERNPGYGLDRHCEHAEEMIREATGKSNAHVHFLVGGTPANVITIVFSSRALRMRSDHL